MKPSEEHDRSVRVIVMLREIAQSDVPITANEIAERTSLPKATVYRLCEQLLAAGLIKRQIGGRGYIPGQQLIDLSQTVLSGRAVYSVRHAILQRVARTTGETCNLSVPAATSMIYWDRVETEWPLRLQLPVGTRVPFHATAAGKLYLASLNTQQCERLLAEVELQAYTERTVTSPEKLLKLLPKIAEQGYSLDDEEFIDDITAVGVPIHDIANRFVGAIAVTAPKSRMPIKAAKEHIPLLRDAAQRIAKGIPEAAVRNADSAASTVLNRK